MTDPVIAAKTPVRVELEPGTYYWCACGRSASQPMCDGSHAGTDIVPLEFTVQEKKPVVLCRCKRTAKAPFCDGSHRNL